MQTKQWSWIWGFRSGEYEEGDLLRKLTAPPASCFALIFALENGGDNFVRGGKFIHNYTAL